MLLLLGVLVRHLQRFTLGTCHAWAHVPAESILVCASNNLLQARAADRLSNPNPNPNLNRNSDPYPNSDPNQVAASSAPQRCST